MYENVEFKKINKLINRNIIITIRLLRKKITSNKTYPSTKLPRGKYNYIFYHLSISND